MHTAAGVGAVESIELLLSAGLSPRTRDHSGRTPLHHACLFPGSAAARCVSFLCAVAGSTVLSRDRTAGDTPLHFAVRARHGVCVEVLLSFAEGTSDILREANAKGETPLDLAAALSGDDAILLALLDGDRRRRQPRSNGGKLSYLGRNVEGGAVDFERIMAIWERFFENAARADLGGKKSSPDVISAVGTVGRGGYGGVEQLVNTDETRGVEKLAEDGRWLGRGQPRATQTFDRGRFFVTTSELGGGGVGESQIGDRNGRWDGGWCVDTADSRTFRSRSTWRPSGLADTSSIATARDLARGTPPQHLERDGEDEHVDVAPLLSPHRRQGAEEDLGVQVEVGESGTTLLSSNDADLHLFHTPRGGDGVEAVRLPERIHGNIDSTLKPSTPASKDTNAAAEAAADNPYRRHGAWIACWDAASESIYYWDSNSGESSWNAPAPSTAIERGERLNGFPSPVWDPQREAFFTIDEDGASHWLVDSPGSPTWTTPVVEHRAATDGADGDIASLVVQEYTSDRTSASEESTTFSSWQQGLAVGAAAPEQSSSEVERDWDRDALNNTVNQVDEVPAWDGQQLLAGLPYSFPMLDRQAVQQLPNTCGDEYSKDDINGNDDLHGFFDAQEEHATRRSAPSFSQVGAGQECAVEPIDGDARADGRVFHLASGEEQQRCLRANAAAVVSESTQSTTTAGKGNQPDGNDLFDTEEQPSYLRDSHQDTDQNGLGAVEGGTRSHDESAVAEADDPALTRLPLWVQWCSYSPHDGDDTNNQPYFVNEETGESSWVLPPDAVAESRGWLRAWSEEHQAHFFANQWTGNVAWDLLGPGGEGWSTPQEQV
ncbi:unnamed protein product [Ectocarpus sp. 6 AP-2014]